MREESKEMMMEPEEKEQNKSHKKAWMITGIVLLVCAAVYVGMGFFFNSHFYLNSRINGVGSSAASVSSMEQRLRDAASGYSMTIVAKDGTKEILTKDDLGMEIRIQKEEIANLVSQQNGFLWGYYLFVGKEYMDDKMVHCDMTTLYNSVSKLQCVNNSNPIKTKNATVTYKNGEFEVVDEVYGTELDIKQFSRDVQHAALTLTKELNLVEDKCYKQPEYTADSKEMKDAVKNLNKCVDTKITYQVGTDSFVIEKDKIGSWLSVDSKLKPKFDKEAMGEYVAGLAKKYDTYGQPKQLATQYGTTVTVPGGSYGWRMDQEKEVAQLMEDIKGTKDVKRDFVYLYEAASREGNDYGNSYVEINKTAQHLYLVIDGAVVLETPMVSGKADGEHDTPTGAYRITYCEKNATLRGPGYVTPVAYWMPFNGDIGLHDATWQKAFGGQRYREGFGSHGCVNLPLSAAGTIFSYVKAGFPVLMYDLPGTETIDTLTRQAADACKNAINAIGAVTIYSGDAIAVARAAYDALSDSGKACVDNYQVLLDAEAAYADVVSQEQLNQEKQAKAEAAVVIELIKAIGDVTPDSGAAIKKAEDAYNALSDYAKTFVGQNYITILQQARETFDSMQ